MLRRFGPRALNAKRDYIASYAHVKLGDAGQNLCCAGINVGNITALNGPPVSVHAQST